MDYFYVFGERHLNYLLQQAVDHYHVERPHQGLENELILHMKGRTKNKPVDAVVMSDVGCKSRLGGFLKHYYRKAA